MEVIVWRSGEKCQKSHKNQKPLFNSDNKIIDNMDMEKVVTIKGDKIHNTFLFEGRSGAFVRDLPGKVSVSGKIQYMYNGEIVSTFTSPNTIMTSSPIT